MQSDKSSQSTPPASQPAKPAISETSGMLTPSERQLLRQGDNEARDLLAKEFAKNK